MTHALNRPDRLVITAYGLPAPQGSKRHVGNGVLIESNQAHVTTWRQDVKHAALDALADNPEWNRDARAVVLHATFTLPRPRYHFRTGKSAHLLRDGMPTLHAVKPDLDKLLRSTGDALTTAGAYADDSRVAQVFAVKCYVTAAALPVGGLDRPGAVLVLTEADAR